MNLFLFVPNLGVTELIVLAGFLFSVPSFAVVLWGIIDAATQPARAWAAIEGSQALWIGLMAGGLVLCFPAGFVIAVYYLVSVRTRLSAAASGKPQQ